MSPQNQLDLDIDAARQYTINQLNDRLSLIERHIELKRNRGSLEDKTEIVFLELEADSIREEVSRYLKEKTV